jgi:GT2 family glycosyltransferase
VIYHNRRDTIRGVLDALRQQGELLERIVVLDNGSDEALSAERDITVHRIEDAVGVSAARNLGLKLVDSELVLLLDDDVYPARDCLRRLMLAQREARAAVVCPRIVLEPDGRVIQCDGASIHFAGMLILRNQGAVVGDTLPPRTRCNGFITACLLVERRLLLHLGGLAEDYFIYQEDMELSYRLAAQGFAIWCEPAAVALHDPGAGKPGLSYRGAGPYPARHAYYTLRHRWLTMLLHYEWRTLLLLSPALAIYEVAAFIECLRRGWLGVWIQAASSLILPLPSIMRRRQRWQRSRRVHDRDILTGGRLPFASGFVGAGLAQRAVNTLERALNWYWNRIERWLPRTAGRQ